MTAALATAGLPAAFACYDRELEWNEPPSASERRWAGWTVVRAAGEPAARWLPLARLGAVALYLAPPGADADAPALYAEPVAARKRGRKRGGDYVGVDGQVMTSLSVETGTAIEEVGQPVMVAAALETGAARGAGARMVAALPDDTGAGAIEASGARVRVAVIDVAFANVAALDGLGRGGAAVEGPYLVGLIDGVEDGGAGAGGGGGGALPAAVDPPAGHGTVMAGIVLHEVEGARVGLFRIPSVAGAGRPYLAAADLTAAVAAAAGAWRADVVLIAMSDGAWGTPRALRDVLREAARAGRGGRGAAIFCSVGDPSRNHARRIDSAALGADDLASQPWVQAISACDARGRWYRVYPDYAAAGTGASGGGATYNRFGPAVSLSASGEPRRFGPRIAADDSSQATALAAAAAASVLGANPALTALELRDLLALTATVPPEVDGGRGLAAGSFDERDRLGHNLKLGYGAVDTDAATLAATDPLALAILVTAPLSRSSSPSSSSSLASSWHAAVCAAAASSALARAYLAAGPAVSRAWLGSLAVKEALCWLARHLHAIADAPGAGAWWSSDQDHGALVERVRYAAECIRDAAAADPADPAARFASLLDTALGDFGDARAGTAAASLARHVAPVRTTPAVPGASLREYERREQT